MTRGEVDDEASAVKGEDAAAEGEDLNGEAYRRKIEALKQDMGDGWLKAFSQSQAVS